MRKYVDHANSGRGADSASAIPGRKGVRKLAIGLMLSALVVFLMHPVLAQQEGTATQPVPGAPPLEEAVAPEPAETTPPPVMEESPATVERAQSAVATSVEEVRSGTQRVWDDYFVPLYERFVAAVPTVLAAIAILVVFWIAAVIAGWIVTRLLTMTDLDNRLVKDLGLGDRVRKWEDDGTSLEKVAGTAVKWVILLFGFVAFFERLDLVMVAGPLGNILNQITEFIPSLLKALAYLALYWVVGTLLKLAVTRGLGALGFDERAGRWVKPREVKGEVVGPSAMVGRLVFWVVLLFGLPPFLEALGQEAAVAPLRNMMNEFFGFLPNVVAALILVFVGRIVATIVREVVTNFLAATGADGLAQRVGIGASEGSRKLSEIVGSIAFFFTIIPIIVAAVDSLQIDAISEPVKTTLEQVLAAIPLIVVALLVMGVGYLVAKTVRGLVEGFLRGVGFDTLPGRIGLGFLVPKEGSASLSSIAGNVVMVIILLLTAQQALASLQLDRLSALVGGLVAYLPNLFVGVVILLAALSLGNYVGGLLEQLMSGTGHGKLAGTVARYAIFFLGFSMGLSQLGVADEVVRIAVGAVLGGTALALGIAFGLGGRDRAKEVIDGLGK